MFCYTQISRQEGGPEAKPMADRLDVHPDCGTDPPSLSAMVDRFARVTRIDFTTKIKVTGAIGRPG